MKNENEIAPVHMPIPEPLEVKKVFESYLGFVTSRRD
jgi:hypothetical protein